VGAGTKHIPGQHTLEHGLLANAKQPGNNSPDFFAKHNQPEPEHQPAGTDKSEHERSGNFDPDRHRGNRHRHRNLAELQPVWCGDARHYGNRRRQQQLNKRN